MSPEEIFRRIYRIRRVEEEVARVYPTDVIQSPVHLSIGQELASVAVCGALRAWDAVFASYRGHAAYLAAGGDLKAFVAELYGKAAGCAKGKGGSMHLAHDGPTSQGLRFMGTSAIVGSMIPIATGYADACQQLDDKTVTACFFGDGATEEGCYFEALNWAALRRLPILFVCENNGYAIHTRVEERQATGIAAKAEAFGIRTRSTDDSTIIDRAKWAVRSIREQGGPMLIEHMAERKTEHVGPSTDWHVGYRREASGWDCLKMAENEVIQSRQAIREEVDAQVAAAFAFAAAAPFPGPEELWADLYG